MKKLSVFIALLLMSSGERLIVTLESKTALDEHVESIKRLPEIELAKTWNIGDFCGYLVETSLDRIAQYIPANVVSIEEDFSLRISDVGISRQRTSDWYLDRIDQRDWNLNEEFDYPSTAGGNTTIYIVDTGIDRYNENFVSGFNESSGCLSSKVEVGFSADRSQGDVNGHGTFVASLAAGYRFGVAKNASLVSVQALDANGETTASTLLSSIQWISDTVRRRNQSFGRAVVNLSLGAPRSSSINRAITSLYNQGIVVVVAAGNEGVSACLTSPSSADGVISVGSVNKEQRISEFSNTGSCVHILAPGEEIIGARATLANETTRDYCRQRISETLTLDGTSFASPLVAGTVALYLTHERPLNVFNRQQGSRFVDDVTIWLTEQATRRSVRLPFFSRTPNLLLYTFPYGLGVGQ